MMKQQNKLRRRNYLLAGAALAGLVSVGLSTLAHAQPPADAEYRVGNLIESGTFSHESWKLDGFHVADGGNISRKGDRNRIGTATATFKGPNGYYQIRIRYMDEGDGISKATLTVGDKVVGRWDLDGVMVNTYPWKEFDGVKINKGDQIVLSSTKSGYEYARYYGMEILPSQPRKAAADVNAVEKKEYSMNLVPLSAQQSADSNREYLVGNGPIFAGGAGTYWVYLQKNQPFQLTVRPSSGGGHPSLQYSLTKAGEEKPLAEDTLVSEDAVSIYVNVRDVPEGLYKLKIDSAPGDKGSVKIDFNVPAVRTEGVTEGYFFVPKGAKALSAKATGHVVLQDAAGKVMFDDWLDKNSTIVAEVPAGSDGQLWYFQGALKNLAGAPPYFTARRDTMLVPAELLK